MHTQIAGRNRVSKGPAPSISRSRSTSMRLRCAAGNETHGFPSSDSAHGSKSTLTGSHTDCKTAEAHATNTARPQSPPFSVSEMKKCNRCGPHQPVHGISLL